MTFSQIRERQFQAGLNSPPCVDSVESRLFGRSSVHQYANAPRVQGKISGLLDKDVSVTESNVKKW